MRLMGAHMMAHASDDVIINKLMTGRLKVVNSTTEREVLEGVQAKLKAEPEITKESVFQLGLHMYQIKCI